MAHQGKHSLPVHFYKDILKTNLQKLEIPKKLSERYESEWSNPVFIKPPDSTEWKVYWSKKNGQVWFEKGWKEFAGNYSLDEGYRVVFKYEGASKFGVVIHGQDTIEIEYPSCDENGNLDQSDDESAENSVSIDIESDELSDSDDEYWPDQSVQMRGESSAQRTSSLNFPRETRAKEVAEAFVSNNPFFTLTIKPCDLVKCRKTIHRLEGYVEKKNKDVMLHVGEREWKVKMMCFHKPPILNRQFCKGWSAFAKENELQPEDVCVFELINREEPVAFEVHVSKCKQNLDNQSDDDDEVESIGENSAGKRTSSLNWPKEARAKEVARAFISTNPFITIFIEPCDLVKRGKPLPCLGNYIDKRKKVARLRVGRRSWIVRILCQNRQGGKCFFSAGWIKFAQESELQPGDVCVFELINREEPTFMVHVTKHNR